MWSFVKWDRFIVLISGVNTGGVGSYIYDKEVNTEAQPWAGIFNTSLHCSHTSPLQTQPLHQLIPAHAHLPHHITLHIPQPPATPSESSANRDIYGNLMPHNETLPDLWLFTDGCLASSLLHLDAVSLSILFWVFVIFVEYSHLFKSFINRSYIFFQPIIIVMLYHTLTKGCRKIPLWWFFSWM